MAKFTESTVEDAALLWLDELRYSGLQGPEIAPEEPAAERASLGDAILPERLRAALGRLNPNVAADSLDEVFRKLALTESPSLILTNRVLHRLLVNGIDVEGRREDGSIGAEIVRVIDFEDPDANDWVAVNQFTVIEGQRNRRPDIVIFVNGLPLAVVELKNAADKDATLWDAFNQIQTYKEQIPSLFLHNALAVISDGLEARVGTISADKERFMPWRTIEGETLAPVFLPQLEVLLRGVFDKRRFLDLLRHFIVFEEDTSDGTIIKKMAGYHQFHAVNSAIEQTIKASRPDGTRQAGVVWHTQGSGKSLTMVFYAGRLVLHPVMENPTIVVLTDRNDLDEQLFGTFSRCQDLLRQTPVQANDREDLQKKLRVQSGGIVFTTIQKFFPDEKRAVYPTLSERRNIVVIADEAHRSQYDFIDGFARHMHDALPNASFIGFTGTPIELKDANTRAVFGDYISIYDIQRAVEDKATVPIYYEGRLAKLGLDEKEKPKIDPDFEEATEGEEVEHKEKLKTKWAALEAVVGADKRLRLIADDLVRHWEARLEVMDGKAMIVCMSRRICYELYEAIRRLRPDWHDDDDTKGVMKIVMTGAAPDPLAWQPHIRTKKVRENLAKRFKNPNDPFKVVIVRDMWLTGFDVPCLHTMYVDKPMRGHGLMQAIARVNRVFRDKPGGLVVDYLGLAQDLKKALAVYTESGGKGRTAVDQEEAVEVMLEKYEVCCVLFHGFDWSVWTKGTPAQKLSLLPIAQEHILKQPEGKDRLLKSVNDLSLAFALAVPHPEAIRIRDDVGFSGADWEPETIFPLEVIDGQHRLWAFEDFDPGDEFELPVVAFCGLDRGWQAYLFWSVNITPKRINRSLAFDLYPLLRQQTWLDRFFGHPIYRETRCQELVEALWGHPESPWYQRINMLGEKKVDRDYKGPSVTQAAWIRSLSASFVKHWEGRSGGLFGAPRSAHDPVLPWSRPMQAAVLIFAGNALKDHVKRNQSHWAKHLRNVDGLNLFEGDDPAFYGDYSLLSTDQGIRGFLFVVNDLCVLKSVELNLADWRWESVDSELGNKKAAATDEASVSAAIRSFGKTEIAEFVGEIAKGLASYDWRTSSTPELDDHERLSRAVFRGSSGYKEMRRQLLLHLSNQSGRVKQSAQSVIKALNY